MKFLVIEDHLEIREIIVMVLDSLYEKAVIHECATLENAQIFLGLEQKYDLVICDFDLLEGKGSEVYQHLRKKLNSIIPFIFQTSHQLSEIVNVEEFNSYYSCNNYLQKPYTPMKLEEMIVQTINESMYRAEELLYVKIRPHFFLRYNYTQVDIYLRLSNEKYVKVINRQTQFTAQEITRYIDKNIYFLYVTQEDYQQFETAKSNFTFLMNIKTNQTNLSKIWHEQFEIVKGLMSVYGLSNMILNDCERLILITKKRMESKAGSISKMIYAQLDENHYLADHSLICMILCNAIFKELKWEVLDCAEKFIQAALFHDITLTDELSDIELYSGCVQELSPTAYKKYQHHPLQAAQLIKETFHFSREVEHIIMEHHERPDGSGFPRKLDAISIHSLSAIFIVAHAMVMEIYQTQFDPRFKNKILTKISAEFSFGKFVPIIEALQRALKDTSQITDRNYLP
jgi:response regulator RpfG family c-di-GMP phosphodiesterase